MFVLLICEREGERVRQRERERGGADENNDREVKSRVDVTPSSLI